MISSFPAHFLFLLPFHYKTENYTLFSLPNCPNFGVHFIVCPLGGESDPDDFTVEDPIEDPCVNSDDLVVLLGEGNRFVTEKTRGAGATQRRTLFAPEFANALSKAIDALNKVGVIPKITSGFRNTRDYKEISPGTNPKAKNTLHQSGYAIDIAGVAYKNKKSGKVSKTKNGKTIINTLAKFGLKWGGTFNTADPPHFYIDPWGYTKKGLAERKAAGIKTEKFYDKSDCFVHEGQ